MNSLLLAEGVFVRVPVDDGLDLPVRSNRLKQPLDVQELAIPVAQGVMDEENGRPGVGVLQVAGQPLALRFAQKSGDLVRVKQRVEQDEAQRSAFDHQDVFAGNLLRRALRVLENLEEVIPVIVVAQTDVNRRLLRQRRQQLPDRPIVRNLARQPGRVPIEDHAVGTSADQLTNHLLQVLPGQESAILVFRIGRHVRIGDQRQVHRSFRCLLARKATFRNQSRSGQPSRRGQ